MPKFEVSLTITREYQTSIEVFAEDEDEAKEIAESEWWGVAELGIGETIDWEANRAIEIE